MDDFRFLYSDINPFCDLIEIKESIPTIVFINSVLNPLNTEQTIIRVAILKNKPVNPAIASIEGL
jgi:hypothetical protein